MTLSKRDALLVVRVCDVLTALLAVRHRDSGDGILRFALEQARDEIASLRARLAKEAQP